MTKHFFITGKIGIGKSTLIKNCITPYQDTFSGFYTQKVFNGKGLTGFRLCNIDKEKGFILNSYNVYDDLFIFQDKKRVWHINEQLFREQFLFAACQKKSKIMLLDEIGGFEVRNEKIMERIMSLLESSQPVLGILKARESKQKMQGIINLKQEKIREIKNYEKIIMHNNIDVYELNADNYDEVKNKLERWLKVNCGKM